MRFKLKSWRKKGSCWIMTIQWTKRCGFLWLGVKKVTADVIGNGAYWFTYPTLEKCALCIDLDLYVLWQAIDMGTADHLEVK